jgi:ACS family tartrate transporter-like MFS transporter
VLSGTAAAAGIAVINSIGNLAGFFGPYAMGWIKDATGSFTGGLLLIATLAVVGMVLFLAMTPPSKKRRPRGNERAIPQYRDAIGT